MNKTIKAAELKARFAKIPDDADVSFGPSDGENLGTLTFYRVRQRASTYFNVEFNEPFVLLADLTSRGSDNDKEP